MESLVIQGTEKTPEINFNSKTGKLYISGRSYSSDTFDCYKPINDWLSNYSQNPHIITILEVNVDYFHSVSVKYLTTILKKIAQLQAAGKAVQVIWMHQTDENEENEAYELGRSIESEAKIKFDFVVIAK